MITEKTKIQIEAFRLGFENPKQFDSLEVLKKILKENGYKQNTQDALIMLKNIYDELGEETYCFWCGIALSLPSKYKKVESIS